MKKITVFLTILLAIFSTSCKEELRSKRSLLPNISGAAGEVVVVLHKEAWDESIGLAYKDILKQEYPMIPQSEPIFELVLVPPSGFSEIFKSHRNIVITKVGAEYDKAQIVTQKDVWASPQIVLNVVGPTFPAIAEMLQKERERLVQLLEQAERDRVVQNAIKFEEKGLRTLLENKFGVSMYFPKGYRLNVDSANFVWISHETPDISQGIMVYEYPYTDANTFTVDYLIEKRNSFVSKYVAGPTKGTYMITETVIKPEFKSIMFKERYFGQLRGLWDVQNHPMGGPFISLTTIDEEKQRVITVEGYVYAPRLKKRNFIRQVEALLLSIDLKKES